MLWESLVRLVPWSTMRKLSKRLSRCVPKLSVCSRCLCTTVCLQHCVTCLTKTHLHVSSGLSLQLAQPLSLQPYPDEEHGEPSSSCSATSPKGVLRMQRTSGRSVWWRWHWMHHCELWVFRHRCAYILENCVHTRAAGSRTVPILHTKMGSKSIPWHSTRWRSMAST